MKPILSKPQWSLLVEIEGKSCYVANYYAPAKVLVKLGLCKWVGDQLVITDDGREIVKERTT